MTDKIQLTEATLISGEVALSGVYDRDQFNAPQLEWLQANGLVRYVDVTAEAASTAERAMPTKHLSNRRKRPVTDDAAPPE